MGGSVFVDREHTIHNMSDEEGSSPSDDDLCTRAITGSHNVAHQAIYVCETCQLLPQRIDSDVNEDANQNETTTEQPQSLPSCLCQCCAETCHADRGHDVFYVGMGPCSCDCPQLVTANHPQDKHCCLLQHRSIEEAKKLGFDCSDTTKSLRQLNNPLPLKVPPHCTLLQSDDSDNMMFDDNNDDGDINNKLCIECNTSMGYSFGAFTLPTLAEDEDARQSLIRQAEILVGESKETFWMPALDEMDYSDGDDGEQQKQQQNNWCDLERLAREIYQHHVKSYRLNNPDGAEGGAEWWVQYKPAGSQKAPVDLHYDKDEVLAEKFALGSFPTVSTVTYLTGRDDGDDSSCVKNITDNEPTVIFPHTYNDDEDRPIGMMLLSHAVKGKHIAFDGRLLHGAPSNAALQPHRTKEAEDSSPPPSSSLRVTFLVNIWLTGKPAGVDVLPENIRSKVMSASSKSKVLSGTAPEFRERNVARLAVGESSSYERIVLPFLSSGATWMEEHAQEDGKNGGAEIGEGGEKDDDDDEEESDAEEELVLSLPQFATPEYIKDQPDTALFTFETGAARLIRGDNDEPKTADCPWKLLIASNKEAAGIDDNIEE